MFILSIEDKNGQREITAAHIEISEDFKISADSQIIELELPARVTITDEDFQTLNIEGDPTDIIVYIGIDQRMPDAVYGKNEMGISRKVRQFPVILNS